MRLFNLYLERYIFTKYKRLICLWAKYKKLKKMLKVLMLNYLDAREFLIETREVGFFKRSVFFKLILLLINVGKHY